MDYGDIDKNFETELALLDQCDSAADIIILPEYSDVLANTPSGEEFICAMKKYGPIIEEKVCETAIRCGAVVFANYGLETERGYRNTTHIFDENGQEVGRYFKAHPAPSEMKNKGFDNAYPDEIDDVYTWEWKGLRFGFRTCYDFYFYEDIVNMARKELDIIIGCSYQRTDTHKALEIMNAFLAYNTNAYVLRSSISLGADSEVCGCSMAVAPTGEILTNMKNKVGIEVVEFDPKQKYYKVSGFGGQMKSHYEYVDEGRK
jgi:predicted amidohydrolase